ncbi:MAG TPA: DUF2946 family protein [Xanthobacteraceae bacterium]|jgi:hypothetical protein
MRWFRTNIRFGSRLALFALAVQIVLSFGHVHVGKIATSHLPAHAMQLQAADGNMPSHPGHAADANDFCAICASIAMVASSVLPEPALPAPPVATSHLWSREFASSLPPRQAHFLFQARAPPFIG